MDELPRHIGPSTCSIRLFNLMRRGTISQGVFAPGCFAFALCSVGGGRPGMRRSWAHIAGSTNSPSLGITTQFVLGE
jgi:hypothetical protein